MNKITISGRLTKDGETRTTQSGKEVYSNSLAVSRNFKNSKGEYDTDFFEIVKWNPTDYIKDNTKKGTRALITGSIYREEYTKDKETKYVWKVQVEEIELFLDKKNNEEEKIEEVNEFSTLSTKTEYQNSKTIQLDDSSLPF